VGQIVTRVLSTQIGFLTAVVAEVITDQGLFYSFTAKEIGVFSTVALVCVSLSAGLAYVQKELLGARFKEVRPL
jgi:UPF0716 family protein affecting phage T7 exclusion